MKVQLHFILCLVAIFFQVKSYADDGVHNGLYYSFDPDGDEAYCCGFYWNNDDDIETENIAIPSTVNFEYLVWDWENDMPVSKRKTFRVVGIGQDAFANCSSLKSVSLPYGLKEIGFNAFGYCENLETVIIGSGLVSVGESSFYSCLKLRNVILPNTVKVIEQNAFYGCKRLNNIILPPQLQEIGSMTFSYCDSLRNVILPRNLQKIGYAAFGWCGIKSIIVPKSVQETDEFMGGSIFTHCDSLKDVIVHGPKIFNWPFFYCDKVRNLTIGDEVEEISEFPMSDIKLNRLTIGQGLKRINDQILRYSEIDEIYCSATEPPVCSEGNRTFSSATYKNATLIVPEESIEKYKYAKGWSPFFEQEGKLQIAGLKGFIPYKKYLLGATADGVSQLEIYPEFTDTDFTPISYDLKLYIDGKDVTRNTDVTGEFKQCNRLSDGHWGFVYTAPKEYPFKLGNKYEIEIKLSVYNAQGKEKELQKKLGVARPGVLLLHGFFSDASCFRDIRDYLIRSGDYASWQINNANYEPYNTRSFDANTHTNQVVQKQLTSLFYRLAYEGYISSKYDIVGHSMGGILARKYAQEVNADAVNSIITINTPHSGSQGADFIMDDIVPFVESIIENVIMPKILSKGSAILGKYIGKMFNVSSLDLIETVFGYTIDRLDEYLVSETGPYGAFNDLKTYSDAIRKLNSTNNLYKAQGIPVHAMASYMTNYQTVKEYDDGEWTVMPVCIAGPIDFIRFFPNDDDNATINPMYYFYERLFGDLNDGVVAYESQRGGLDSRYSTTEAAEFKGWIGQNSKAYHTEIAHWADTWTSLGDLLRASKTEENGFASSFKPIFYPPKITSRNRTAVFETIDLKEASDATFVRLSAEMDCVSNSLRISLDKSSDISNYVIFAYPNDQSIISAHDTTQCLFSIPESFDGDFTVYALARTQDYAITADSLVVHVDRTSTLNYLYIEEDASLMSVGNVFVPHVICGWSGGTEEYVSPDFFTDNSDILGIDGQNITALKEGECKLYATYLGQTDSIRVKVISAAESTAIQEVKVNNKASFSYNGSHLLICFDDAPDPTVTVDVYDLAGIRYFSKTDSNFGGNLISVDVSSLASGMYIATARTKKGMINYRFIKQ